MFQPALVVECCLCFYVLGVGTALVVEIAVKVVLDVGEISVEFVVVLELALVVVGYIPKIIYFRTKTFHRKISDPWRADERENIVLQIHQ